MIAGLSSKDDSKSAQLSPELFGAMQSENLEGLDIKGHMDKAPLVLFER